MSKKNKKKGFVYFNENSKSKKSKKSKKNSGPKLKVVRPTIDHKDMKRARKIILAPVDIPKEFTKIREKCNHADKLITPQEFRNMTPAYSAYTPMLDAACRIYGEENVHVCKSCYDVLVNPDLISVEEVDQAVLTMYMAANKVLSMRRMKADEVKAINKIKTALADWNDVADELEHIEDNMEASPVNKNSGIPANLNAVGNSPVIM